MNAQQTQAHVDSLERRLHYLEAMLPDVYLLVAAARAEKQLITGGWTERDEAVWGRLASYDRHRSGELELPEVDTVLVGEAAQYALDGEASRLHLNFAPALAPSTPWHELHPASRDQWRSKALKSLRFMNLTYNATTQMLVRLTSITGTQLRALLGVPADHQLVLEGADVKGADLVIRENAVLIGCEHVCRFRSFVPVAGA